MSRGKEKFKTMRRFEIPYAYKPLALRYEMTIIPPNVILDSIWLLNSWLMMYIWWFTKYRKNILMGHGVGPYLGLDGIGSPSSIIIFIIISYLFNRIF